MGYKFVHTSVLTLVRLVIGSIGGGAKYSWDLLLCKGCGLRDLSCEMALPVLPLIFTSAVFALCVCQGIDLYVIIVNVIIMQTVIDRECIMALLYRISRCVSCEFPFVLQYLLSMCPQTNV